MISVIIPAFNATATIGKCLIGLKKQTLKPKEIIIVDDGSSDDLESVVKKLKLQFHIRNLTLLKQNHKGVSEARNLGAKKASGEILAFIDSDCIPGKNWLKNINNALSDHEIGAVGGGYSSGIDNSFWQKFSSEELSFRRRKRIKMVKTLLSNNMACRKSCFWQARGFPNQYPVCEDMFLSYQISRKHNIIWLKNNGVKHHFKRSFLGFLKHQYFFGKESTRFFLENPHILTVSNHQGRSLHLSIIFSSLGLTFLFSGFILMILNHLLVSKFVLGISAFFLLAHFFLYLNFLFYLKEKDLSILSIVKAYLVSFSRDLVAALSFMSGLTLYIKK